MSVVTMKQLLEAGVHFGHQTHKWNPKMKKYIFIKRNGIHILDLKQTVDAINEAYQFLKDVASRGEEILFVGTKKQAVDAVKEAAEKAGVFYVNNRWYGGMLTNMKTIRQSIEKMKQYEQITEDGSIANYTKLEALKMKRMHDKIESGLGGIREMQKIPGAIFVVDTKQEAIAIHEAKKLNIPLIGMVDTNCDPDKIDFVIPSNDDAIRAISLIADVMANAVIEGRNILQEGNVESQLKEEKEVVESEATTESPAPEATKVEAEVVEEAEAEKQAETENKE
ncbi:30S ribosomal protein S2 [bacterium]|nr:30S ribosomal protein S2 [bacterium]